MSRNTGTFNFSANFEVLAKGPLDAKQLVGTKADLINPATWNQSGSVWLYDGAVVSVGSDSTAENNGIYYLTDANNYTDINSWVKSSSGGGTITGGTNGLSTSGANIVLGGDLTGNTTISGVGVSNLTLNNINDFQITPSGTTDVVFGVDEDGILMSLSGGSVTVTLDDEGGLKYGGDYSLNYTNRSLIDKEYADNMISGLKPKEAVHVATTPADGDIILSGLTQTIDGHILTGGERVLIKDQISGETNGIYDTSSGAWNRSTDFDGSPVGEVVTGSYVWVLSGDTNLNTSWVLVTVEPITVGVTSLEFVYFNHVSDVIEGHGITIIQSGTTHTISVDGGSLDGNSISWSGSSGNETFNVDVNSGTLSTALDNKLDVTTYSTYTGLTQPVINNAITGATNGLTKSTRDVKFGGVLSEATTISGESFNLFFGQDASRINNFGINSCESNYCVNDFTLNASNCVNIIGGDFIIGLSGNTGTISDTNSTGLKYGGDYSGNYDCLSIPNAGWVTGQTSTSGIQTAINGLSKNGTSVRFGGDLTGDTIINLCNNSLRFQSDTTCCGVIGFNLNTTYSESKFGICSIGDSGAQWGVSGNSSTISAYHCSNSSNGSDININDTGLTLSNKVSSVSKTVNLGVSGLTYGDCYHNSYGNRSLIDKEYLDIQLSGTSNVVNTKYPPIGTTYYTLRYDDLIPVSGISNNEIYLYPTPVLGQRVSIVDVCGGADVDPIIINGNGNNINNGACSIINTDYGGVTFTYNGYFWSVTAFVN